MRSVTHGDAVAAASALVRLPEETWQHRLDTYLRRADAADRYRKRMGRFHPRWGNGSLMGAVLCDADVWPEPMLSDPRYAEALVTVLLSLMKRRPSRNS